MKNHVITQPRVIIATIVEMLSMWQGREIGGREVAYQATPSSS
jgi:hypothetical protein